MSEGKSAVDWKTRIKTILASKPPVFWVAAAGGLLVLFVSLTVLGWSHSRFTRISICLSCHEIFVDYAEYAPTEELSESVEDYKPIEPFDPGHFNVTVGCAECHAYPYEEYRESPHYYNDQDIRPGCVGCHEPHSVREVLAWKFFYVNQGTVGESPFHAISNSLRDVPAWEALRIDLAHKVRADMIENDSKKCKTCHKTESEWFGNIKRHKEMGDKTCIQCHYNLVHKEVEWANGE